MESSLSEDKMQGYCLTARQREQQRLEQLHYSAIAGNGSGSSGGTNSEADGGDAGCSVWLAAD